MSAARLRALGGGGALVWVTGEVAGSSSKEISSSMEMSSSTEISSSMEMS